MDDNLGADGTLTVGVDPGEFDVKVSLLNLVTGRMKATVGDSDEFLASLNLPRRLLVHDVASR